MPEDLWRGFHLDPRRPEHARLRASDEDREVGHRVLVAAYVDGRMTVEELEARSARLDAPITLGGLLLLLADLEPTRALPASPSAAPSDTRPACSRVSAPELTVFVLSSAVCVLLWWLTGRGFFWPLWVIVYTGIPPLLTFVGDPAGTGRGNGHSG